MTFAITETTIKFFITIVDITHSVTVLVNPSMCNVGTLDEVVREHDATVDALRNFVPEVVYEAKMRIDTVAHGSCIHSFETVQPKSGFSSFTEKIFFPARTNVKVMF